LDTDTFYLNSTESDDKSEKGACLSADAIPRFLGILLFIVRCVAVFLIIINWPFRLLAAGNDHLLSNLPGETLQRTQLALFFIRAANTQTFLYLNYATLG
jgi:hypothetical protein